MTPGWLLLGATVAVQLTYPLAVGPVRWVVTVATVLLGTALGVGHALLSRGPRWTALFFLAVSAGSSAVEIVGVATGWPFGAYRYTGALGPQLAGVPLLVPLAWSMMAYPAWLAAVHLVAGGAARVVVAGWALAGWDVFLDPQMVSAGRWVWLDPAPALPGVPGVPVSNYLAWLLAGLGLMAAISVLCGPGPVDRRADAPVLAFFLWTYAGSVVAHAVFLDLPGSALWGGLAMGLVAVPLAVRLARS